MEWKNHSKNLDNNDEEEESPNKEEEHPKEVRVLKMLMKANSGPRVEVPMYDDLNVEELMDWINALNKYFDFEEIEDKKKVRYATTRMKGHAFIWWDEVQIHWERRGK